MRDLFRNLASLSERALLVITLCRNEQQKRLLCTAVDGDITFQYYSQGDEWPLRTGIPFASAQFSFLHSYETSELMYHMSVDALGPLTYARDTQHM